MPKVAEKNRRKVSATLSPKLIRLVEAYQREADLPSFSAALEELVWRELMEEEAKAYYLSLSQGEREQQARWASFATAEAGKVWARE